MSRIQDPVGGTETGVVTLCGVQGCCPTVDFTNPEEVVLCDDHGGRVRLTRPEWDELKQTFGRPAQG